jgi:hypothetical protein
MLNNVLNYAFYSNNSDISIVQNSIINFNNNIINTPGIEYNIDGNITLVNIGIYKVTYYIQTETPNKICLNLNNVTILNSEYSSDLIDSGIFLFNNTDNNSILNLINLSNTKLSNNAYLLIEQLS